MQTEVKEIVHELMDIGAFKVDTQQGFRLSLHERDPTAPLSPFYLNLRTKDNPKPGPLGTDIVRRIAMCIAQAVHNDGVMYTHVCGIPNAGTPFAKAVQGHWRTVRSPVGLITMNKGEAGGQRQFNVTRQITSGTSSIEERVLLIDDLVTSETVKRTACGVLRSAGYTVPAIGVFLDRRPEITPTLGDGTLLCAVLTIREVLEEYEATKRLSRQEFLAIKKYLGL